MCCDHQGVGGCRAVTGTPACPLSIGVRLNEQDRMYRHDVPAGRLASDKGYPSRVHRRPCQQQLAMLVSAQAWEAMTSL